MPERGNAPAMGLFGWIVVVYAVFAALSVCVYWSERPVGAAARKRFEQAISTAIALALLPAFEISTDVLQPELWRTLNAPVDGHRTYYTKRRQQVCDVLVRRRNDEPLRLSVGCRERLFCPVGENFRRAAWSDTFYCGGSRFEHFPFSAILSFLAVGLWVAPLIVAVRRGRRYEKRPR